MIKEAGLENSGVVDGETTGRAVFVSTTARMYFRQSFPDYAKVRNNIVNQYLANMFAQASPTDYFRPKKGSAEEVGEIREAGGGKFIGIIANDHVRVLAIKGGIGGSLPSLSQEGAPAEAGGVEQALQGAS